MVRLRKPDVNVVEHCGTNQLVSELGGLRDYTSSIEYRSIFDQYIYIYIRSKSDSEHVEQVNTEQDVPHVLKE